MNIQELASKAKSWAAIGTIAIGIATWGWGKHNEVLVDTVTEAVEPLLDNDRELLRGVYASRINSYRKKMCMGDYSNQVDLDIAMAKYKELVGRDISDRSCDSLM